MKYIKVVVDDSMQQNYVYYLTGRLAGISRRNSSLSLLLGRCCGWGFSGENT
ncbi:MAG: hypothetical protein R6V46_10255 [Desulfatiglandaceae bacterium]